MNYGNDLGLKTIVLPGSVVQKPNTHANVDDTVEDLKQALREVFFPHEYLITKEVQNMSDEAKNRMFWALGGCLDLVNHFAKYERHNFGLYNFITEPQVGKKNDFTSSIKPLEADDEVGECGICLCPVTAAENAALLCNHIICRECSYEYISRKVQEQRTDPYSFICPGEKCKVQYNAYHVFMAGGQTMDSELLTKYLTTNTIRAFESSPFMKYCSNKQCNKMVITKGFSRRYVCTSCGTHSCGRCRKKYHKVPLCREKKFNAAGFSIKNFFFNLTKDTQQCPQCKYLIQRTEGCDHMRCAKCNYYFCWKCGDDLDHHGVCLGRTKSTFAVWGPLLPFKMLFDFTKDVAMVTGIGVGAILLMPSGVYIFIKES